MRRVFADTVYWVALINPKDQWRPKAAAASKQLGNAIVVTSDMVLTEVLNLLTPYGQLMRTLAVQELDRIRQNANIQVVPQTREVFESALELYRRRLDQGLSLTDCSSIVIMRDTKIQDVLSADAGFATEGFFRLL